MAARVAVPAPKVASSERSRPPIKARVKGKAATDKRFQRVLLQVEQQSAALRKHPPASKKAEEAQAAAKSPPNEKSAGAKAGSVDTMEAAKPNAPQTDGFEALLLAEIDKIMPKTDGEAKDLVDGKKDMTGAGAGVASQVETTARDAAAPVDQAASAPPNEGAAPSREATALPREAPVAGSPPDPSGAVPPPKPAAEVDASAKLGAVADQKREAEITDDQLSKANDPRFSAVKASEQKLQQSVQSTPGRYRAGENRALSSGVAAARGDGRAAVGAMGATARQGAGAVQTRQQAAKANDEARRKGVTDKIEAIYKNTKDKVEQLLDSLERDAVKEFDKGAKRALSGMQRRAKQRISSRSVWSKIANVFGLDPSIKRILDEERAAFQTDLKALAKSVARLVDQRLADAKAEVKRGQTEITTFVATLPRDLQSTGREAAAAMAERFAELESGIDQRKQDLATKLAQRYADASKAADDAMTALEKENEGLLSGVGKAIGEVIKILKEMKAKLLALLRKGADAIKKILADPIGFLGNLIAAIKGGLQAFVSNFVTHLTAGFKVWLGGELAKVGVEPPADLSLGSLFKVVLQVLGISWPKIRQKCVAIIGEPAMKALETLAEFVTAFIKGGPGALWEKVKEFLSDLKSMVVDMIIEFVLTTIVQKAVTKLVSMMNPAGAFVQACLLIYDVVVTVVTKAAQIFAFVEAVVNSISAIANGAIGGAVKAIEGALARLIPLAIAFLAQLTGLNKIVDKIIGFIKKIQSKVDKAIDFALKKIVTKLKSLIAKALAKLKGSDDRTDAEKQRDLTTAKADAQTLIAAKGASRKTVQRGIAVIKRKYKLNSISLVEQGKAGAATRVFIHLEINPRADTKPENLKGPFEPPAEFTFVVPSARIPADEFKSYIREFARQLGDAEKSINAMSVEKWRANRHEFRKLGSKGMRKRSAPHQRKAREESFAIIQARIRDSLLKRNWDKKNPGKDVEAEANRQATVALSTQQATHAADTVIGGDHDVIDRLGGGEVNMEIGRQWGKKRSEIDALYQRTEQIDPLAKMNISLKAKG